jgi:hypothetical protein
MGGKWEKIYFPEIFSGLLQIPGAVVSEGYYCKEKRIY